MISTISLVLLLFGYAFDTTKKRKVDNSGWAILLFFLSCFCVEMHEMQGVARANFHPNFQLKTFRSQASEVSPPPLPHLKVNIFWAGRKRCFERSSIALVFATSAGKLDRKSANIVINHHECKVARHIRRVRCSYCSCFSIFFVFWSHRPGVRLEREAAGAGLCCHNFDIARLVALTNLIRSGMYMYNVHCTYILVPGLGQVPHLSYSIDIDIASYFTLVICTSSEIGTFGLYMHSNMYFCMAKCFPV